MPAAKIRILFVCMGNVCRSPLARGALERLLEQTGLLPYVELDTAGTHAYHEGRGADPRAAAVAARRGMDLSAHRARRFRDEDFERFDYILALDRENLAYLEERAPAEHRHKVRLLLSFCPELGREEVPDPYYGGLQGFDLVMDLVEAAAEALVRRLRSELRLAG